MIGTGLGLAAVILLALGLIAALGTSARRFDTVLWIAGFFTELAITLDERLGEWFWNHYLHTPSRILARIWKGLEHFCWHAARIVSTVAYRLERGALGENFYHGTVGFGSYASSPYRGRALIEYNLGYDDGWDDGYNRGSYDTEKDLELQAQLITDYGLTDDDLEALLG